jgi:SpoVK/Ycf46/Vps4 family AAA+-type ATPase
MERLLIQRIGFSSVSGEKQLFSLFSLIILFLLFFLSFFSVGATNIPWDIDEAVLRFVFVVLSFSIFSSFILIILILRRLAKRIYVPLPDPESRKALITHLLKKQEAASHPIQAVSSSSASNKARPLPLNSRELDNLVSLTEGYSGSDLSALCHEAALGPIREIGPLQLKTIKAEEVRGLNLTDFTNATKVIRPSVSRDHLKSFQKWSDQFGVTR